MRSLVPILGHEFVKSYQLNTVVEEIAELGHATILLTESNIKSIRNQDPLKFTLPFALVFDHAMSTDECKFVLRYLCDLLGNESIIAISDDDIPGLSNKNPTLQLKYFSAHDKPVRDTIDYIFDHIADLDLNVDQIASGVGMTTRQLKERFKPYGGLWHAVLEIRLDQASRILQRVRLPIKEVAYGLGFADLSTFDRSFKQRFGVPPRTWTEMHSSKAKM